MNVAPSSTFEAVADLGATGLTPGVRILDNAGATTTARTTAGISEYPAGSGIYHKTLTAPAVAGQYTIAWDNGSQTAGNFATEDLLVTSNAAATSLPSGRDLCALADVTQLVPGYTTDTDTDALLAALITAESRVAHQRAGREFVTVASLTTRQYDLANWNTTSRRVRVGDMTTVTTVTVEDQQGTTVETIAAANRVSLPRVREEWEPITDLWFPAGAAAPPSYVGSGYVLEVVGVWGFPAIPADLVVATAKMVLVRYLSDAASAGTALSDALNDQGFDAGRAFASARDVIRSYSRPPLA